MSTESFAKSASYYDPLYRFWNYAVQAQAIQQRHPLARTLLDVACGTGKHLEPLRSTYEVEGLDLHPELLTPARGRCSDVRFQLGDMTDFHLDRTFDIVTCLV